MNAAKKKVSAAMLSLVMVLCFVLAATPMEAKAAQQTILTTTMECSVWSAPSTKEQYRVKKIPANYPVTVYTDVIQSQDGDGKTFYKTAKGAYILCKCFGASQTPQTPYTAPDLKYGYAGNLSGRTLIVTFIENDTATKFDNKALSTEIPNLLKSLGIATDYIKNQCARYGVSSEFLYDWNKYPDLAYFTSTATNVRTDTRAYKHIKKSITDVCDLDALMKKYNAQNVVCVAIYNTDSSNTKHNATYMNTPDYYLDVEIVRLFTTVNYGTGIGKSLPSSIAHEILHAFGAPDLYCSSGTIPQNYVDYITNVTNLQDIMRVTNWGDKVNAPITEVSAYYLGLGPDFYDRQAFGLGLTEKAY